MEDVIKAGAAGRPKALDANGQKFAKERKEERIKEIKAYFSAAFGWKFAPPKVLEEGAKKTASKFEGGAGLALGADEDAEEVGAVGRMAALAEGLERAMREGRGAFSSRSFEHEEKRGGGWEAEAKPPPPSADRTDKELFDRLQEAVDNIARTDVEVGGVEMAQLRTRFGYKRGLVLEAAYKVSRWTPTSRGGVGLRSSVTFIHSSNGSKLTPPSPTARCATSSIAAWRTTSAE
jgi:hypothetical protein